jgi:TPR repeat protein
VEVVGRSIRPARRWRNRPDSGAAGRITPGRDARAWACEPLLTRPLHEQALVTEQRDGYVANDYVVDRVVKRPDRPPVPAPVWSLATSVARESFNAGNAVRLWNVGVAAYGENALDYAITAMSALASGDDADAMVNLGLLLEDRGGREALVEAEAWYRRAAERDDADAMVNLGLLLENRGGREALVEAEAWYRRAARHDDPDAMFNLGVLLRQRRRPEALGEAEAWWRRAAKRDHPEAIVGLGLLLGGGGGRDKLAEADAWYRRVPKHGQPERRRRGHRAGLTLALLGTAAATVLALMLVAGPSRDGQSVEFALTATELVPGAQGTAEVTPEESGLRIELNATGLPRRDDGLFYQAWLANDAEQLIPIGTFHDGNDVVLWAGVSLEDYPTLTITEEEANNDQGSSKLRVLVGTAPSG